MKYSEAKSKILILKKHSFVKRPKLEFYERTYSLQDWNYRQYFANHDLQAFRSPYALDKYLTHLYGQRMKILLEYVIEDYIDKINLK